MSSALTWFEIPTLDIERARTFYEQVLETKLRKHKGIGYPMWIFPYSEGSTGGALIQRAQQQPSMGGTMVYLRVEGAVSDAEARVSMAGGSVIAPKMTFPNVPGEIFVLKDTEGNLVGVHGGF
ncbi:MAG: VOC family protein [Acidobacteriaceae bacterium]